MGEAENGRGGLRRATVRGVAVSFGSQVGKFVMQFAYQILLARLLSPEDFGLVAMAAPIVAFVQLFADFGLSQATIQRPAITQAQLSLLFWINVGVSALLALVVIAISPFVGLFYKAPPVAAVTAVSGALFLVSGLFGQHLALLNRHLAFGKLAIIDVAGFAVGAGAGLLAAGEGLGYWAILVAQGVTSIASLILAWRLSSWVPGRPAGAEEWRSLIGFGGNLTGFNLVNYFARNLDNVLIGRFNGEAALGLYDRAYKLLLMPLNQVSQPFARVALPLLSRTQDEPAAYRRAYLRMIELIILLTYPGILFAVATHEQLIRSVLGDRWSGVAPIFAILGIGALFAPISNSTGWLFISQNRTAQMRNWGIFSSLAFVLSFVVGLRWGPIGVASCYVAVGAVQGPLVWWAATREGPVRFGHLLGALWPHGIAGGICFAVVLALQEILPGGLLSLAAMLGAAYVGFVGTLFVLPGGRGILEEVWNQVRPTFWRPPLLPNEEGGAG